MTTVWKSLRQERSTKISHWKKCVRECRAFVIKALPKRLSICVSWKLGVAAFQIFLKLCKNTTCQNLKCKIFMAISESLFRGTENYPIPTQYSEKELLILQTLKSNPSMTQGEMAQSLGMDTNQIKYYLNKLKNGSNPAIRHIGTTRNGYWEVLVKQQQK